MKRLTAIAVFITCLLIAAGLSPQSARAEDNVRCGQKDSTAGSCEIVVRAPGSGGQPGRPAQPRNTGGGGSGGGGSEEPSWPIEGCIQYDPLGVMRAFCAFRITRGGFGGHS